MRRAFGTEYMYLCEYYNYKYMYIRKKKTDCVIVPGNSLPTAATTAPYPKETLHVFVVR